MGYGDISGSTTGERGFLIVMMLVGAIIYALILALMTSVMQQVFLADEPLTQKVDILDRFFQLNPIDAELQDKVNNTLEYEWDLQVSHGCDPDAQCACSYLRLAHICSYSLSFALLTFAAVTEELLCSRHTRKIAGCTSLKGDA